MTVQQKSKLKKNDEVIVTSGRDKGRRGEIIRVMNDGRLMVAGVNMVKKHKRPNPNVGDQGGIIDQEAPIQASNVAIWNHESERADKIGLRIEDGKKTRFFKSNGKEIDS
ncbi:MAG TPA: 50S ribosomal protein L24 [Gammaproteobacteria bacterium]|jgi:large subunit ribosomal protein L24|nr:50S ribosomal protein L24 [Gammaproteobacteria bacterium]|tara:strand:- start:13481 stop:13810 length:330 start_codon:yes stop_codon:yes gene_type:complete